MVGRPSSEKRYERKIADLIPRDREASWTELSKKAKEQNISKKTLSFYLKKFQKNGWIKKDIDSRKYMWQKDVFDPMLLETEEKTRQILESTKFDEKSISKIFEHYEIKPENLLIGDGTSELRSKQMIIKNRIIEIIRLWHEIYYRLSAPILLEGAHLGFYDFEKSNLYTFSTIPDKFSDMIFKRNREGIEKVAGKSVMKFYCECGAISKINRENIKDFKCPSCGRSIQKLLQREPEHKNRPKFQIEVGEMGIFFE